MHHYLKLVTVPLTLQWCRMLSSLFNNKNFRIFCLYLKYISITLGIRWNIITFDILFSWTKSYLVTVRGMRGLYNVPSDFTTTGPRHFLPLASYWITKKKEKIFTSISFQSLSVLSFLTPPTLWTGPALSTPTLQRPYRPV